MKIYLCVVPLLLAACGIRAEADITVLDLDGAPVEGATIEFSRTHGSTSYGVIECYETDDDGEAELSLGFKDDDEYASAVVEKIGFRRFSGTRSEEWVVWLAPCESGDDCVLELPTCSPGGF